jgi:hypothetical protein
MDIRHDTLELARFLSELSVIDYFFVTCKPSVVALAALLNAMESIPGVSDAARLDFDKELKRVPGLNPTRPEVEECRSRLRLLYSQGGYSRPEVEGAETRAETISPVCVSFGCTPQRNATTTTAASPPDNKGPSREPQVFRFSSDSRFNGTQFTYEFPNSGFNNPSA